MGGAERKTAADPTNSEGFATWWISQAGGFANGQPPLHFLTGFLHTDTFTSERSSLVKTEVSIEYCVV
jgi:hypothetical protein